MLKLCQRAAMCSSSVPAPGLSAALQRVWCKGRRREKVPLYGGTPWAGAG
jgi:hypothetical protein